MSLEYGWLVKEVKCANCHNYERTVLTKASVFGNSHYCASCAVIELNRTLARLTILKGQVLHDLTANPPQVKEEKRGGSTKPKIKRQPKQFD